MGKEDKEIRVSHPEGKGLALIGAAFIAFLGLLSFKCGSPQSNWLGLLGYGCGFTLHYLFGIMSYGVLGFVAWMGWHLLSQQKIPQLGLKAIYFSLLLISCCVLLNLIADSSSSWLGPIKNRVYVESMSLEWPYPHRYTRYNLGGVPLYYLYKDLPTFNLEQLLSPFGIGFTFSITALVSFSLLTRIRLLPLIKKMGGIAMKVVKSAPEKAEKYFLLKTPQEIEESLTKKAPEPIYLPRAITEPKIRLSTETEPATKTTPKREAALTAQRVYNGDFASYELPPPALLTNAKKIDPPSIKKDLKRHAEILEETLLSFGIEAKVGEIYCGPTITLFEVHPAVGVKVQKITALENDIALKLQAPSIRIIAPIPGKAAVGVEVPSLCPQEVSFKEMLIAYQQGNKKLHIPVLLGKTVTGENVVSDLTKMPHCIIAGATGSGKSVCINTLIMSILMNSRPDEIKLLMIDPKKVELTSYANLPHMIAPVITEAQGAYAALNWLVKEMQLRYDILKQLGLRNITAFNNRSPNKELEASLTIPIPPRMYAIVAIIDEFADLMMVSSSDLETPIARIAQMARAVGIHLVLATQRPSREVITGLIKANFPTRIAFKVASRVNSQIILDDNGADTLLGNGDMLFLPPGSSHLIRAQGAYISDEDINRVVHFISNQAPPHYLIPSFDNMRKEDFGEGAGGDDEPRDTLYEEAKTLVLETQTASTTFLQRKLKVGYARAASLMDELERNGIISPQEGSRPRRILNNKGLLSYEAEPET